MYARGCNDGLRDDFRQIRLYSTSGNVKRMEEEDSSQRKESDGGNEEKVSVFSGQTWSKSISWLQFILLVVIFTDLNVCTFRKVSGRSMEPSIFHGQIIWIKYGYESYHDDSDPSVNPWEGLRGKMVVFTSPNDPIESVVKRITYLPGERNPRTGETIPQGHVYVLGDNPKVSLDSRIYGPIPIGLIKGVVFYS